MQKQNGAAAAAAAAAESGDAKRRPPNHSKKHRHHSPHHGHHQRKRTPWRPWQSARHHTPPTKEDDAKKEGEEEEKKKKEEEGGEGGAKKKDTQQRIKKFPPKGRYPHRHREKSQPKVFWKREKFGEKEEEKGEMVVKHPRGEEFVLDLPLCYDPDRPYPDTPLVRMLKLVAATFIVWSFLLVMVLLLQQSEGLKNAPAGEQGYVGHAKEVVLAAMVAVFLLVFVLSGLGKGPGDEPQSRRSKS